MKTPFSILATFSIENFEFISKTKVEYIRKRSCKLMGKYLLYRINRNNKKKYFNDYISVKN